MMQVYASLFSSYVELKAKGNCFLCLNRYNCDKEEIIFLDVTTLKLHRYSHVIYLHRLLLLICIPIIHSQFFSLYEFVTWSGPYTIIDITKIKKKSSSLTSPLQSCHIWVKVINWVKSGGRETVALSALITIMFHVWKSFQIWILTLEIGIIFQFSTIIKRLHLFTFWKATI